MIWIVDTSVALKWFVEEEFHPNADEVLNRIVEEPETFAVPEIFTFEVYIVLQRVHPAGMDVFKKGVIPLLEGGIFRHPMTEKLAAGADRYSKMGLTGYDACYAALAQDFKGIWLTFDKIAHEMIRKDNVSCFFGDKMPRSWIL